MASHERRLCAANAGAGAGAVFRGAMLLAALLAASTLLAQPRTPDLRVGVAGTEPFVVIQGTTHAGIAVEIWQTIAAEAGWRYQFQDFANVPEAMEALRAGQLDAVVGPVSITAERAQYTRFSQPFFTSRLAILSRTESPTPWQRIRPFFSRSFFLAVTGLLAVLALVGTLIWLAERRGDESHFPLGVLHGIGSGVWFAIVTMSTVGYGDMAPKTPLGRLVTGIWIVISFIAATSLVAGIASTLTLTGINSQIIGTAEQLRGKPVAVLTDSPGQMFAQRYGARINGVDTLADAYNLLEQRTVDAIVFDRPQLQYFLRQRQAPGVAVSSASYAQQNYGFALPLASPLQHDLNLNLLELGESGSLDRIVQNWLGGE